MTLVFTYYKICENEKLLRLIDLPVVMQAMFIVQLQIVPDKVLLGNRDSFTDNWGRGEGEEKQN